MQRLKPANDFEDTPKRPSSLGLRALVLLASVLGAVFILGAVFYIWLYVQQVQNGYRLAISMMSTNNSSPYKGNYGWNGPAFRTPTTWNSWDTKNLG